jgi:hypothetical protein
VAVARKHTQPTTRLTAEADESLEAWEETHRARIDQILRQNGFPET